MEGDDDYAEDRRADGAGAAGAEDAFAGGSLDGRSGVLPAHLNPDVVLLRRAYVQEKCVPELLPFQKDAVETLTTGLAQQQAALDAMNLEAAQEAESRPKDLGPAFASSSSDAQQASGPLSATSKSLYSADIERQRYLLAVYLRTRLRKVRASAGIRGGSATP